MPRHKQLSDPVEEAGKLIPAVEEEAEFDSLDVSNIKVEVLPESAAKAIHPFDGYPVQKIKIDMEERGKKTGKMGFVKKEFRLTDWVLHNHLSDPIHQDPSNKNRKTYHSRSVMDILGGNSVPNVIIQFSTPIKTASGVFFGALVPDPYIRSQIIFTLTKGKNAGRIVVDKRYMLLDPKQDTRLKKCFMNLMRPQQEMEKTADALMAGEQPEVMKEVEYGTTEL
jgi:hypothetical protein